MAVAIVHYHLRPGGVTRVIEAQSRALTGAGIDHIILSGTPCRGRDDLPVRVIPALDYREKKPPVESSPLTGHLREVAATALGRPAELWHLHNPCLGKNIHFPDLVRGLSVSREPLVLHFHDFAEDGRPQNYQLLAKLKHLYPVAPHICYAFINSRDRDVLVNAGVPIENTALLPNAVIPPEVPKCLHREPGSPALVVYPVRGIRRKNIGEICLLAGLAPTGTEFAVTLAPENPQWQSIHNDWIRFAEEHRLRVQFGVVGTFEPRPGVASTFENWLAHATHLVTTSIAEGFGMAFLEPIALGKPLFGRDLPEITRDFKHHQLALGQLYDHLLVPVDWIDPAELSQRLEHALRTTYARYGEELSVNAMARARNALTRDGCLDFGALPEPLQRETATRAWREPGEVLVSRQGERQPAATWLAEALRTAAPASPPSSLDPYSVTRYADFLTGLYQDLRMCDPAAPRWLKKSKVLHQFLQPERFHFLRT